MTRYEQGFMSKCAEYGVDGRALLKLAQQSYMKPLGPKDTQVGPASYVGGQWMQDTRPGWTKNKETGVWSRNVDSTQSKPQQPQQPTQPSVRDYTQGLHDVPRYTEDGSSYGIQGHPYYNYMQNVNKYMGGR